MSGEIGFRPGDFASVAGVVRPVIDGGDLLHETLSGRMVEIKEMIKWPVEVECYVRDLLIQTVSRVRQNPPDAPPATSTVKVCSQEGHCTLACV